MLNMKRLELNITTSRPLKILSTDLKLRNSKLLFIKKNLLLIDNERTLTMRKRRRILRWKLN